MLLRVINRPHLFSKHSRTDYDLNSAYLDRRIIGLVSAVNVYDQATGASVSKTTHKLGKGAGVLPFRLMIGKVVPQ